jgi:molybdopterin-containing oxidoreductase family iron-sulfur binding subunit
MGMDRRKFLKISGLASLSGFGVSSDAQAKDTNSQQTKRWALIIDMKKCREVKDCTDCVAACHKVHNVPDIKDKKREIKWIWKETFGHAFPAQNHDYISDQVRNSPSLVLCNHCDNPPCVGVCPTQATFRRDSDGLVMMDFHRCIGCRYCMVACPYGARSFNWHDAKPYIKEINTKFPIRSKGVVEKCNLCAERIAKEQIPACAEACKAKAITFGDLHDPNSEVRKILSENDTIRRKPHLHTLPNVYYIM